MLTVACESCLKQLQYSEEFATQQVRCPSCNHVFQLPALPVHARTGVSCSTWYYMQEKLFGDKEIGPLSDVEFLNLVKEKKIKPETVLRSPEATGNQWTNCRLVDLPSIQNQVNARLAREQAEEQRRREAIQAEEKRRREAQEAIQAEEQRRQGVAKENLQRLREYIKQSVADGRLQKNEHENILQFAKTAGIAINDVWVIIKDEADILFRDLIDRAMEDGELSPDEEAVLESTAKHFGLELNADGEHHEWLEMGRMCWLLNNCEIEEYPELDAPFKLQAREKCVATESVDWFAVKQSAAKSSPTIRTLGSADLYATNKRVIVNAPMESKTFRYTSIASVRRYRDGILLIRNSGGNFFFGFKENSADTNGIGLLMQRMVLPDTKRVRASRPMGNFIVAEGDEPIEATIVDDCPDDEAFVGTGPRFTFRVVGTSYENRHLVANKLGPSEQIFFVREPWNPHDLNAIAVVNKQHQMFGYLKREVAEWFAPMIDGGYLFTAFVYRIRANGVIIAGVNEL